jgi:hypothetical protein
MGSTPDTGYEFRLKRTDGTIVTVSSDNEHQSISDLLELFNDFMRGCGYHFNGSLVIVEADDSIYAEE